MRRIKNFAKSVVHIQHVLLNCTKSNSTWPNNKFYTLSKINWKAWNASRRMWVILILFYCPRGNKPSEIEERKVSFNFSFHVENHVTQSFSVLFPLRWLKKFSFSFLFFWYSESERGKKKKKKKKKRRCTARDTLYIPDDLRSSLLEESWETKCWLVKHSLLVREVKKKKKGKKKTGSQELCFFLLFSHSLSDCFRME